jgi:hypothetical protein
MYVSYIHIQLHIWGGKKRSAAKVRGQGAIDRREGGQRVRGEVEREEGDREK